MRYVKSMVNGKPEHHVGHNPAGAVAIVLLILLSAALVMTGWSIYNDIGGEWLEELHEGAGNLMLAVVSVAASSAARSRWGREVTWLLLVSLPGGEWGVVGRVLGECGDPFDQLGERHHAEAHGTDLAPRGRGQGALVCGPVFSCQVFGFPLSASGSAFGHCHQWRWARCVRSPLDQ